MNPEIAANPGLRKNSQMASGTKTWDPDRSPAAPYVVRTKLRPPHIREGLLERPDLVQALRSGRERTLTLVCAPAGYGKSTVLAQWAAMDADRTAFAWVSLDAMDSDPARLWGHVITALQDVHGPVGQRSLKAFSAGPRAIAETGLPLLVDELSECPPVVLVLEDWHTAASPVCDETMGVFLDRAPSTVQVVISSRHDPRLHIARLRAHGDLTELRARDLSVSSIEADALLREADVRLTTREVQKLTERTEGWLAGLCLAAIALKERVDPQRFVNEFSGDTRNVFDYLAGDVLAAADPGIREFMAHSSVLERLSAPLCDVVLERSDSASMLAEIERSNFFLVPLDATGTEYRYHHLFADVLRRQLETTDPEAVPGLHARASLWFEDHGEIERAIDHAIACRDLTSREHARHACGRPVAVCRSNDDTQPLVRLALLAGGPGRPRARDHARAVRTTERARTRRGRAMASRRRGRTRLRPACQRNHVARLRGRDGQLDVPQPWYRRRRAGGQARARERACRKRMAIRGPRAAGTGALPRRSPRGGARTARGGPDAPRRAASRDKHPRAGVPLSDRARRRRCRALGTACAGRPRARRGDRPHCERRRRQSAPRPRMCPDDAGQIFMRRSSTSNVPWSSPAQTSRRTGTRMPTSTSLRRDIAWETRAAATDALSRARAELDELPDVGILGELYWKTDDALHHRARHEGFLGEELSDAERRVLDLLLDGLSVSQVARELWLSPNTVKTHRRNIYRKLGARTREEMVERAAEAGIPSRRRAMFTRVNDVAAIGSAQQPF